MLFRCVYGKSQLIVDNANIKLEFQKRYYYWALEFWEHELQYDFVHLRKINCREVSVVLDVMSKLDEYQKYYMASGLVKRFRTKLLNLIGEDFSVEESNLVDLYMNNMQRLSHEKGFNRTLEKYLDQLRKQTVNRLKFKQTILEAITPVLGDDYERLSRYEWRYSDAFGSWQVDTYIDIGGRYHQLTYDHVIKGKSKFVLQGSISVLSWLGISSQTSWCELEEKDTFNTAEILAKIVGYFMNSVPDLLIGLGVCPSNS